MPSTDQMILDLVAIWFRLPEGLSEGFAKDGGPDWWITPYGVSNPCPPAMAYDLIACEFARQVDHDGPMHGVIARTEFNYLMGLGDTEAAIKALWEAVCGDKQ